MPAPGRGPGTYPSGGPEPQVGNIWKFGAPAFKLYPGARIYKDFRQMFDKEEKNFDALIVATPDPWPR
jgi:hypothetical protein